ncbi:MAG: hypothetical protein QM601_07400, partial [Pseudoxanthomonas sp.]
MTLLAGIGALSVLAARRLSTRACALGGGALIAGTALGVLGVGLHALPLYIAALAITGCGWGVAYAMPAADERMGINHTYPHDISSYAARAFLIAAWLRSAH